MSNNQLRCREGFGIFPIVVIFLCFSHSSAIAQRGSLIEEIVVTANKREQNLQDVAISVAAMSEDQLRGSGANHLVDAARNFAGLTFTDLGPGQGQTAIRGLSSGQVLRDESARKESVGVYLDESSVAIALFTPDLDFFDINRLEVLRGPQGTLFGSSSIGGTVRYITNQPNPEQVEGAVELSASTISGGSEGYNVKGVVNIPFADGKAALRAVGYNNNWGGFIDAITPNGDLLQDVNEGSKIGGRLTLMYAPNDALTITPRFVYQKLETDGYPRADVVNFFQNEYTTTRPPGTFGEFEQFLLLQEGTEDEFSMFDLKVEADFGATTFTSVSSYIDREINVTQDGSALTSHVNAVAIGLSGPSLDVPSPLRNRYEPKAFSQEFRLTSNKDGAFQWLVGAFYLDREKGFGQRLDTPGFDALTAGAGLPLTNTLTPPLTDDADVLYISNVPVDHRQYSVFGEASYQFAERWTATAGGRWFNFDESRSARLLGLFGAADDPLTRDASTSDDGFNPRFILSYAANDDITINAQASKGFRLGGINDPLIAICQGQDVGERFNREEVWNYELGMKSQFADSGVRLNTSVYHMVIDDLQVSDRLPCSITVVGNVPESEITGVEFELFANVAENLDFSLVANYNNAEVTKTNPAGDIGLGERLATSPEFQFTLGGLYSRPISSTLNGYVNATVQYNGDSYSVQADQRNGSTLPINIAFGRAPGDALDVNFPSLLDAYTLVNFRIGVASNDNWDFALSIKNLLDDRGELALDRERGGSARIAYYVTQPRTVDLTFRKDF